MKPLLLPDMPIEDYHLNPALSKSSLDHINTSVAHLIAARASQFDTGSLKLGRALHQLVLEGAYSFRKNFAVADNAKDDDWRSAAGRAFVDLTKSSGKTPLHRSEGQRLMRMLQAIKQHPTAYQWLKAEGMHEHSFFWTDEITGVPCRCRPDLLIKTPEGWVIVDLKTTQDARPWAFGKSSGVYRYHVQAAFYIDGVRAVLGTPVVAFLFVAVESEAPHGVAVYEIHAQDIERGRQAYLQDLEKWVRYTETKNQWEGYPQDIANLPLPTWA